MTPAAIAMILLFASGALAFICASMILHALTRGDRAAVAALTIFLMADLCACALNYAVLCRQ